MHKYNIGNWAFNLVNVGKRVIFTKDFLKINVYFVKPWLPLVSKHNTSIHNRTDTTDAIRLASRETHYWNHTFTLGKGLN